MPHGLTDGPEVAADDAALAGVIALIAARAAVAVAPADEPPSLWRDRTALLGAPLMPGPGAWRASARPR